MSLKLDTIRCCEDSATPLPLCVAPAGAPHRRSCEGRNPDGRQPSPFALSLSKGDLVKTPWPYPPAPAFPRQQPSSGDLSLAGFVYDCMERGPPRDASLEHTSEHLAEGSAYAEDTEDADTAQ